MACSLWLGLFWFRYENVMKKPCFRLDKRFRVWLDRYISGKCPKIDYRERVDTWHRLQLAMIADSESITIAKQRKPIGITIPALPATHWAKTKRKRGKELCLFTESKLSRDSSNTILKVSKWQKIMLWDFYLGQERNTESTESDANLWITFSA
jgi:hypothetical protein